MYLESQIKVMNVIALQTTLIIKASIKALANCLHLESSSSASYKPDIRGNMKMVITKIEMYTRLYMSCIVLGSSTDKSKIIRRS